MKMDVVCEMRVNVVATLRVDVVATLRVMYWPAERRCRVAPVALLPRVPPSRSKSMPSFSFCSSSALHPPPPPPPPPPFLPPTFPDPPPFPSPLNHNASLMANDKGPITL